MAVGHFLSILFLNLLLFFVLVFPNSFREVKVVLLGIVLVFLILPKIRHLLSYEIMILYLLGFLVTIIYLKIGHSASKMPMVALNQVFLVYILSPLMWILISNYIVFYFDSNIIQRSIIIYLFLGCLSVILGLILYEFGFIEILEYIIENPNLHVTEFGSVTFRFHVYGILIFFFGGFLWIMDELNIAKKILLLVLILVVTILSGRDALRISFLLGVFLFSLFKFSKTLKLLPLFFLMIYVSLELITAYYSVDLSNVFEGVRAKIDSGGGYERNKQYSSLMTGIYNNMFLGEGHGVGTDYVRSEFPWRYELLPLATIFRVGIIGFIVYAYPLIISLIRYTFLFKINKITPLDSFFIFGLISFSIANMTNPYLESFEFQFPYFFSFCYFLNRMNFTGLIFENKSDD